MSARVGVDYFPGSSVRRSGRCIVVCDECGHESVGDYFGHVHNSRPQRIDHRDAWVEHKHHWLRRHRPPAAEPDK